MPEQNEGFSPKETVQILPEELPTTPEIAKQGAKDFKKFVENIDDEELRHTVLVDPHITGLFAGVTPELGFSGNTWQFLTDTEVNALKNILEVIDGNEYLVLVRKKENERKVSLFNLKAVEKVVDGHKDIFPFNENTKAMLIGRYSIWDDSHDHIKSGLLSGYPLEDARYFSIYKDIRFALEMSLADDDLEFFKEYRNKDGRTQGDKVKMASLVYKSFEHIEGDQIEHFVNQETYNYKPMEGFVGFHKQKDEAWVQALDVMYDQSGIENVAKSLQNNLENR